MTRAIKRSFTLYLRKGAEAYFVKAMVNFLGLGVVTICNGYRIIITI